MHLQIFIDYVFSFLSIKHESHYILKQNVKQGFTLVRNKTLFLILTLCNLFLKQLMPESNEWSSESTSEEQNEG